MLPAPRNAAVALAAALTLVFPWPGRSEEPKAKSVPKPAPRSEPKPGQSPADMLEMEVREVLPLQDGAAHAVILSPKGTDTIVPIFIGETEAMAIALRLHGQSSSRPLTHDLLEKVIRVLGAKVTKIYIDDLRDSVYLGRVFLSRGDEAVELDARPSDSIALAVGGRAPVFAARKVVEQAGLTRKDFEKAEERAKKRKLGPDTRDESL